MENVRVRIAPSPTGDPHVGTAYIALFDYVWAKKNGGSFVLRIEDTDRTRSNDDSEKQIFDSLKWLDLNYDEGPDVGGEYGPYRQSERKDIYKYYAEKLVSEGKAYKCFCTPERLTKLREKQKANKEKFGYDGLCRNLTDSEIQDKIDSGEPYVIRLKTPETGQTVVIDELRGEVAFDNSGIDDQILLKTDGYPTYHLANVVDDYLMKINYVIRAEEWIPSTPKHILLYRAFGWEEPTWCHMPLLRNIDKSKISKRKNPVSLNYYKENGYLKEAMVNFLALMGWSIGENREIFTLKEMIENFDIKKISLGGPVFDLKKLGWINGEYINSKPLKEITKLSKPFLEKKGFNLDIEEEKLNKIVDLCRERAETLVDISENAAIYFNDEYELPVKEEGMNKKQRKSIDRLYKATEADTTKIVTKLFLDKLENLNEEITNEEAKKLLNIVLEESGEGPGKVLMPLRIIITGKPNGPDLYNVISIIGKQRVINRVNTFNKKYNIL